MWIDNCSCVFTLFNYYLLHVWSEIKTLRLHGTYKVQIGKDIVKAKSKLVLKFSSGRVLNESSTEASLTLPTASSQGGEDAGQAA